MGADLIIEIDNCLVCAHGLYETDRDIYCQECIRGSNFEVAEVEDLEFLAEEYLDNDIEIKDCISKPAA